MPKPTQRTRLEQTRSTPFVLNRATAWTVRNDSKNRTHQTITTAPPQSTSHRAELGPPATNLAIHRAKLIN